MKKISAELLIGFILLVQCIPVSGWGSKGHYVIAGIAEAHLSKQAKKEVRRLLEGRTMVYYSTWMDEIRGNPLYSFTTTWHYANVDEGKSYETIEKESAGDVITATLRSIEQLKNKNQSDSVRSMYLKFLIHLVGDLHCPMHAGRATDRGGNDYPVLWKGTKANLHSLWDYLIVDEVKNWSAMEWSTYIDIEMDRRQQQAIEAGDPLEWFRETVVLASEIYNDTPENQTIPQSYVRKYSPVVEQQFLKAGYRLAGLLNGVFR